MLSIPIPPLRVLAFPLLALMLVLCLPLIVAAQEVAAPIEEAGGWIAYAKVATEVVVPVLLSIVTGALLILGRYVHRWLAEKLGVEALIAEEKRDALVREVIDGGIAYAEQRALQWARSEKRLPEGAEKLRWALHWISSELQRRGLPAIAKERLEDLVDSRLGNPFAPGGADRAEAEAARLRGAEVDG